MLPASALSTLVNALVMPNEATQLLTSTLYGIYLGMNYLYFSSDRSPSWPRRLVFCINLTLLTAIVSMIFAANYIRDVDNYDDSVILLLPDVALKVCPALRAR